MSGELAKGFLADIVENIDDDTPRLVYADWLTENGHDDRAEFIRVQIERARRPAWDAAQVRLRLREQSLLKQNGEKWLAELPAIIGAKWEGFRRGIVAEVSFASFEAHAGKCPRLPGRGSRRGGDRPLAAPARAKEEVPPDRRAARADAHGPAIRGRNRQAIPTRRSSRPSAS